MHFPDDFFLLLCKIIEKHHLFSLQEVGVCILLIIGNKALVEISAFVYKYHCFCQTLASSCSKEWNLYSFSLCSLKSSADNTCKYGKSTVPDVEMGEQA